MNVKGFNAVRDSQQYVKMLLYGQAGAGKTRFCADADRPHWFDTELSTETLRHWPEYSDIPVKIPTTVDELLRDVQQMVKEDSVGTIVLDSVTTMLDKFIRNYAKNQGRKDRYQIYEADYKYATAVFTTLFGELQEAPINVVIIGHERVARDDAGTVTGIWPDVTPRLQQAVVRLVNVVAYMSIEPSGLKGAKRKLYLNRTPIIEAKNRLNIQEVFIENPSWKEIF